MKNFKSFMEFLLESKLAESLKSKTLNETKEGMELLATFDDAKKFFQANRNSLNGLDFNLDHIKALYEFRDANKKGSKPINREIKSRPEPLVSNYNGEQGAFVFRRWVYDVLGEVFKGIKFENPSFYEKKKLNKTMFRGFKNTSLRTGDQAQSGAWQPSAQDFESIICLAFNTNNSSLNNKEKKDFAEAEAMANGGMITDDEISESTKAKVFYMQHREALDACAKAMMNAFKGHVVTGTTRFDKLDNGDAVTEYWKEAGLYKDLGNTVNNTPKTDIISNNGSVNNPGDIRISLKKSDGAQLMSGKQSESLATIVTAIYRTFGKEANWPDEIHSLYNNLTSKWEELDTEFGIAKLKKMDRSKMTKKDKENATIVQNAQNRISQIVPILNNLLNRMPKFKNNFLYEAITGRAKFAVNSVSELKPNTTMKPTNVSSVANYILIWDIDNPAGNKVYTIQEYIKILMKEPIKVDMSFKTSGKKSYIACRIGI